MLGGGRAQGSSKSHQKSGICKWQREFRVRLIGAVRVAANFSVVAFISRQLRSKT